MLPGHQISEDDGTISSHRHSIVFQTLDEYVSYHSNSEQGRQALVLYNTKQKYEQYLRDFIKKIT